MGSSSELTVFAASSLADAFQALERDFESQHPDDEVSLAFGGSQVLRLQIEQGAPADVFASADQRHIAALVGAGLVRESEVFAHSELALIVPTGNPARIESFADLPRANRVVLGAPEVPVGRYSAELLRRAAQSYGPEFRNEVREHVVSEESNVRLVRAKVELGEADAAIVYRPDVTPRSQIRIIPIPAVLNVRVEYHIGIIAESDRRELALRWISYLRSERAREILTEHGFMVD